MLDSSSERNFLCFFGFFMFRGLMSEEVRKSTVPQYFAVRDMSEFVVNKISFYKTFYSNVSFSSDLFLCFLSSEEKSFLLCCDDLRRRISFNDAWLVFFG
jgi:hypothetical protein